MLVSGCMGPRGDGYDPGRIMSRAEAEDYHSHQAAILSSARPDMLSAFTMNNVNEAIGITRAAADTARPFVLSFTVETDGRSEERSVGHECVRTFKFRWSPYL